MPPAGLVPPHFRNHDGLLTQHDHRCMQRVRELAAKYDAYADRAKVEPWPVAAKKERR